MDKCTNVYLNTVQVIILAASSFTSMGVCIMYNLYTVRGFYIIVQRKRQKTAVR